MADQHDVPGGCDGPQHRVEIPTEAGHEAVIAYLIAHYRRSRNYDKMYGASWEYQRDGRYGLIPYEVYGNRTLILWNGWFPFLFSNQVENKAATAKGSSDSSGSGMKVYSTVTFVRGTLDVEKLLDAARQTDADAVHPGYGFLSERAHFARACADAGLTFVGPPAAAIERMLARIGDRPVYVSVDIDVLDPAHAPGTGTPEAGGLTSRELLRMLRAFAGTNLVGADIVEVSPSYDHAEITGIAAAHVGYELLSAMALPKA